MPDFLMTRNDALMKQRLRRLVPALLRCTPVVILVAFVSASQAAAQCLSPTNPHIEIVKTPRAGLGGEAETDTIGGKASGINPEDARILLYAHASDRWWVQPAADRPLITIGANGNWQTETHLGFEYAVLLVDKSYAPAAQLPALPSNSDCVWAQIHVQGSSQSVPRRATASVAPRTIRFSNIDWFVKRERSGPGPNQFSDSEDNVRVDAEGRLHLQITNRGGTWFCAEVIASQSLGHGTYRFSVSSSLADLDSSVVLGMFTWSDDPQFAHRELDVEISRWGVADAEDAQFVIQPWDRKGHRVRFTIPRTPGSVHTFTWSPTNVAFESRTWEGTTIRKNTLSNGVPPAGPDTHPRINLWLFNTVPPRDGRPVEVVIDSFEFIPAVQEK